MSDPENQIDRNGPGYRFLKYRNFILLAVMILIIPSTYLASRIKTDNAIERWLGEDDPQVHQWDHFRKQYDLHNQITVLIEDVSPDDSRIEKLAKLLEYQKIINRVWTPARILGSLNREKSSLLKLYQNQASTHPLMNSNRSTSNSMNFPESPLGSIMMPDRHSSVLWIELNDNASADSRKAVGVLRGCIEHVKLDTGKIYYGGPLTVNASLDYWGEKSISYLIPIAAILCFTLLWAMGTFFSMTLLLLISSSLSVLFTFAFMSLMGVKLNLLLIVLPALIGVLHLSTGIHIVYHYNKWLAKIREKSDAITNPLSSCSCALTRMYGETFKPAIIATLTTVIGMASLITSQLEPVRSFGIWSSVGLSISFVVAYLVVPCFLLNQIDFTKPVLLKSNWINSRHFWKRRMVFLSSVILLCTTVPGWSCLKSDLNAIHFLPKQSLTIQNYKHIEEKCCGLIPVEIDLDFTGNHQPALIHEKLERIAQKIRNHPEVTHSLSVASFYPKEIFSCLLTQSDNQSLIFPNWCSGNGSHFRLSAFVRSDSAMPLEEITTDLQEILHGEIYTMTGLVPLINQSQTVIFESLRDSLFVAGILVSIVLILILKSIPAGAIAMIPNIGPILIGFGLFGWLGIEVGIGTVLTGSIALGIALDDTLHFLHQFKQATGKESVLQNSVRQAWKSCSWPMIQTSLVAATGLLVFSASDFRPVARFGCLMALLLMLALAADLIFLPCLLTTRISRLFIRKTT